VQLVTLRGRRGAPRATDELTLALERAVGDPARVLTRPIDRVAFASDASFYRLMPRAVVRPRTEDHIRSLFAVSHELRVPLTFRAAGTSLSGQAVTDGILVDLSQGWGRIEPLDGGGSVRVGPGAIGAEVNATLGRLGRRIGPDPASIDACMIGGILANNASGMCCGVAENAYHTLGSMRFVLASGLAVDSSAKDASAVMLRGAPALSEGLLSLRRRLLGDPALERRVRAKYRIKNTTGYGLNALLDFDSPDQIFAHLMIGSEGTLGFISQAVLRSLPDFPAKRTGLLVFETADDAFASVAVIDIFVSSPYMQVGTRIQTKPHAQVRDNGDDHPRRDSGDAAQPAFPGRRGG